MGTVDVSFLVLFGMVLASQGVAGYKRVCYFTNWSQYRTGPGKYTPADIDPSLCSNIIFAFAKLQGTQLATIEANDKQLYQQINALKASNPGLKTSLAVGGWTAGSAGFSAMASNPASRSTFIQNAIRFLRSNNFDGLDIDWEYPGSRGGGPQDKQNLASLLKEMRAAFEQEASSSGKDRLQISIAVPAGKSHIDPGYDVRSVGQSVDFINLMAYDLHGSWDGKTGENAPLHGTGSDPELNTAFAANYWASKGAPKDKIIVGMGMYGQTFRVSGASAGVGAPSSGPGQAGTYTKQAGVLAYHEICKLQEAGGVDHWNAEQAVPYYITGSTWVGYDNVRSITEKAEWVKKEGFGGGMIWSLDEDDFKKTCASSTRRYPLLSAMNDVLKGGSAPQPQPATTAKTTQKPWAPASTQKPWAPASTQKPWQPASTQKPWAPASTQKPWAPASTPKPWTQPTAWTAWTAWKPASTQKPWAPASTQAPWQQPTTQKPWQQPTTQAPWQALTTKAPTDGGSNTGTFSCATAPDGYHPEPGNCQGFWRCNGGKGTRFACSPGTAYNPELHECDWPYNVPGC